MQKLPIVVLIVFLMGCSSGQTVVPTETPSIVPSLTPTQTAIPPTETSTPSPTFTPPPTTTAIGGGAGKIAFVSERDGVPEIYVMNPDGSNLTRLANETSQYGPAWSQRQQIAFGSNTNDSASLYIMNADGSILRITDTKEIVIYDQATRLAVWRLSFWSPDGTGCVQGHSLHWVLFTRIHPPVKC
jgi:hypothetical protein